MKQVSKFILSFYTMERTINKQSKNVAHALLALKASYLLHLDIVYGRKLGKLTTLFVV